MINRILATVWVCVAMLAMLVAGIHVGRLLPTLTVAEMADGYRDLVFSRAYVWERLPDPDPMWPEDYLVRGHGSVPAETKGHGS